MHELTNGSPTHSVVSGPASPAPSMTQVAVWDTRFSAVTGSPS